MAILKEFVCAAHGDFDAFEAKCPHGCSGRFVRREIRTAPAIRHGGTRNIDNLTQQLADDFRLTDLSNRDGESVMTNLRKKDWVKLKHGVAPSSWVGGVPHAQPGWTQRDEKAPTFNPATVGLAAGIALTNKGKDAMVSGGKQTGVIPKPRAQIVEHKGQPLAYRAPLPETDL